MVRSIDYLIEEGNLFLISGTIVSLLILILVFTLFDNVVTTLFVVQGLYLLILEEAA